MNITNRGPRVPRALGSRVLAERSPAVAAVGAWVESGTELQEHPATLASITEQLQHQRRLQSEHLLCLFQENVRLRVAEQERRRRRARPGAEAQVLQFSSGAGSGGSCDDEAQEKPQSGAWLRRRLACPRPLEPVDAGHMSRDDDAPQRRSVTVAEDGEHEESPDPQRPVREETSCKVLWPIDNSEELRRQRQTQILTQRRLFLSKDRQNVKENQEQRRHMLRTSSLKQEKERERLQEELRLKEARRLEEVQERLHQREEQVQQTLRTEAAAEERQTRERLAPKTSRLMSSLRVQLRALFSGSHSELPPLCCCGTFWETHPDTCANNCVFHHNPKAYVQALQTVVHSWNLL